jgi:putative ABC transport system permease protein
MNIAEIIRMAMDSLAANKLRSILTMFAIIVGVFAVIGSSTAVLVLDTYFKDTLSVMGGDVVTISTFPGVQMGPDPKYRNRKPITFEILEELQQRTSIARGFSPEETFSFGKVIFEDKETDPNVRFIGSNEFYIPNNAFNIAEGRNFLPDDIQYGRPVCLVAEDVRKSLFDNRSSLGKQIRIDGRPYTIIGLIEAKGSTFGSSQDNFVMAPYTTLLNVYGGGTRNIDISVKAPSITEVPAMLDEITGVLRAVRKVAPGNENDFEIISNNSLQGAFDSFTGVLYIFGIVVGGIALLGAGIGVMNIMLVSVTERTREIGIRKSIGATRKAITQQFLLEAIFICQLGGFFGMILGVAGGNLLALAMDAKIVFPWGSAIFGLVGMTVIGLAFGVFPAMKAAKLDPIESLRYE